MNIITKSFKSLTNLCFKRAIEVNPIVSARYNHTNITKGCLLEGAKTCFQNSMQGLQQIRAMASLLRMHKKGPRSPKKKAKNPLDGKPFAKGVVLKTLTKKPKKPNSANRKCVLLRLSTGKEMIAHVPGIGHNLQEHNIVLVRVGRCKDVPGVKIKCVRGKYDLAHVAKSRNN